MKKNPEDLVIHRTKIGGGEGGTNKVSLRWMVYLSTVPAKDDIAERTF